MRLDWVAVDHFNTGHPHSHVIVHGRDDQGRDLIVAQDYITHGVRLRGQERATLELGPETGGELRAMIQAEVSVSKPSCPSWEAPEQNSGRGVSTPT